MKGFIHQKGKEIYDGNGNPILLKGVGFGNWLLPEGYMWKFYEDCDRPRRIEKLVVDLCGEGYATKFWKQYYDSYITRSDIEYIKKRGLNTVRLPVNARHIMNRDDSNRTLLLDGIDYIDRLLNWCEELNIYVILDMHGAPGGQTGTNIDDSEDNQPMLFIDESYKEDLIWLWTELAKRYKDRKIVAGYDLLNEPLPEWFNEYNDKVMPLYYDLAEAIRQIDENHMIILEGVHWATDWSIFELLKEKPIDNIMLQFHKYWDSPDMESIQKFLDKREELNCPLYMGEGGENNLLLYAGVFHLLEQHNISWNFWTYKKLGTHNSPISVNKPKEWDALISYIKGGARPEKPIEIFNELLNNIKFENCVINDEVLNHVQRMASIKLRAVFYDLLNKSRGHNSEVPFKIGDGTDIRYVSENGELSFKHYAGQDIEDNQRLVIAIHQGESYKYTFKANGEEVHAYCWAEDNAKLKAVINGKTVDEITLNNTESVYELGLSDAGDNILELECVDGVVLAEWVQIG